MENLLSKYDFKMNNLIFKGKNYFLLFNFLTP